MTHLRMGWKKPHLKDGFYGSAKWQALRKACAIRDRHTCQKCGKHCAGFREGAADHKLPRRQRPDLAYELANLWWLCTTCHNSLKRLEEMHADKEQVGADGISSDWKGK